MASEGENNDLTLTQFSNDHSDCLSTPREDPELLERSWRSLHDFDRAQFGRLESIQVDEKSSANGNETVQDGQELWKFGEDFLIPELPMGKVLTLRIKSTWGDPYYVGLNGIEIFNSNGMPVIVEKITAEPKDMTVIPKFIDDPRVIDNLIDGVFITRDDAHLWLAPFKSGRSGNYVTLKFEESCQIAMIRIWNYNKSRIHSYRGVRHLEILLDERVIFKGEVSKAPGTSCGQTEELSDTILFTTDDAIFEKLAKNDSNLFGECSIVHLLNPDDESEPVEMDDEKRPLTGSSQAPKNLVRQKAEEWSSKLTSAVSVEGGYTVMKGRKFVLELRQNWSAPDSIGLNGFHLLDRHGRPCLLMAQMLTCNQKKCDPLNRLINDRNLTTEESDMWLCKFDPSTPVKITIRFPQTVAVLGLRIWNYNRSFELSYAGTQLLNFWVEDDVILKDVSLVKAPGNLHYNFCQDVLFGMVRPKSGPRPDSSGSKDGITGFVFQLQLLSTWGDEFYMGLNGIDLLDENRSSMKLQQRSGFMRMPVNSVSEQAKKLAWMTFVDVAAYPESVNVLPDVADDVRTSDKLIDGHNETQDVKHMWLTPILPHTLNRVYIVFDKPTTISAIVFWNYTKTPTRGVRHVVVLVDDAIVQSCELGKSECDKTVSTTVSLIS